MRKRFFSAKSCALRFAFAALVALTINLRINGQTSAPSPASASPQAVSQPKSPSPAVFTGAQSTISTSQTLESTTNEGAMVQRGVVLGKLTSPPKIDGILEDGEWSGAAKVELKYQTQPGDNSPPSERTEVFLAYGREHVYLAFHAFDRDTGALRARVTRRDDVFDDDYVSVYLDTFDDRRRAYVLYFNPLGIQADGIITGGTVISASAINDLTWDGIFESKGTVTADGYIVEAAIPFKTLRFQAGKGKRWGLHLQRWIARRSERIHWQPISRDRSELLVQMGTLEGLEDVFTGRTLDLTPTLTGSINGERQVGSDGVARLKNVNRLDPGLTAIYSITPNLTLSAAINPDFSQIEADVPQIDVNQRFPLFFPERRPFFLEGNEFFRSPGGLTFVNTRQIVDPDWGLKLTGKIGKDTIGILSASDRAPGLRFLPTDSSYGRNAQFNILRYQRDVLRDSKVGAFVTDRRFAGTSNTVVAADGQLRFRQVNTFTFQLAHSRTRGVDGETRSGGASYAGFNHSGRHWRVLFNDLRITSGYRSLPGFVRRTGFRSNAANIGYEFQPKEKSWWVRVRPFVVPKYFRTDAGLVDESYIDPGVDVTLARGIDLYIYRSWHKDSFLGREYSYQFNIVNYTVNSFKTISFDGYVQWGEGVNFDPMRPGVGNALASQFKVTLKPNQRFNTEFLHIKSSLKDKQNGTRLFNQDIFRNRTIYQFTRNNAVRLIMDYDTARRQSGLSFLYSYTPRPNTALYVGYNDLLFNGLDPLDNRRAPGLFRLRRTFFTKLSYNFRF